MGDLFKKRGLFEVNGQPSEAVRNIILAAAEGEGLKMTLTNPLKDQSASDTTSGNR